MNIFASGSGIKTISSSNTPQYDPNLPQLENLSDFGNTYAVKNFKPAGIRDDLGLESALWERSFFTIHPDGSITASAGTIRLEELRNGINDSADINWHGIDLWMSAVSNFSLGLGENTPKQAIEYFASKYAAVKNQINTDFTGDALKEQLSKLDELMDKYTENYANNFAQRIGEYYQEHGMKSDTEKLYQSVKYAINQKKEQYEDFISENQDYAHLKGTADEWALRSSDYMSVQLRKAYRESGSAGADQTPDSLYTMDDIQFCFATGMRFWDSITPDQISDPAQAGVLLGTEAVKAKVLVDNSNASQSQKDALQSAALTDITRKMQEAHQRFKDEKQQLMMTRIISEMVLTYDTTKDSGAAVKKGLALGFQHYLSSQQDGGAISDFWGTSGAEKTQGYGVKPPSAQQDILGNMKSLYESLGLNYSSTSDIDVTI